MGTDEPTNQPTNGPTNGVSYRGACSRLKTIGPVSIEKNRSSPPAFPQAIESMGWGYSDPRGLFGSVAIWIKVAYLIIFSILKHLKHKSVSFKML
jgi:hypothetical protein